MSRRIFYMGCLAACMVCLFSCGRLPDRGGARKEPLTVTGFAFDTTYTLTLYEGGDQELLDSCVSQCNDYEKIFSRTRKDSELWRINELEACYQRAKEMKIFKGTKKPCQRKSKSFPGRTQKQRSSDDYVCVENSNLLPQVRKAFERYQEEAGLADVETTITSAGALQIKVSDDMRTLLSEGLRYSELSQGGFDCSIGRVSSLWDFSGHGGEIPSEASVQEALPFVDYRKISVQGDAVQFDMPGMVVDLGGIAKGYIADRLRDYLEAGGVTSAIISLGGNIVCIGEKPEGDPFHIGIQQPFGERQETVAAIAVRGASVVSSGIYERYIEDEDGRMYHHILNPRTGYSYENDLLGVTIVSERSVDGDGLSTVCFALGRERGMELAESIEGVEAAFITKDGEMHATSGFEKLICG